MKRSRVVSSFDGLLTPFTREVNAWCFSRTLEGDFAALAARLGTRADDEGGVLEVDAELLEELHALDARAHAVPEAPQGRAAGFKIHGEHRASLCH